jgi:hypothetical protein
MDKINDHWDEFERLLAEAKSHLPRDMNEFSRGAALGALVRGIERTGGDVSSYRDAMWLLDGKKGYKVTLRGKREPKHCPYGTLWLKRKDDWRFISAKAP